MITCPYCGTSYTEFISNCKNCGAPLAVPEPTTVQTPEGSGAESLIMPPPPPRPISSSYANKLVWSDGLFVGSFVFALLGSIFTVLGFILTIVIITAFVGLPFLLLGLIFLVVGGIVLYMRYQEALKIVNVLRIGQAARGQITEVVEDMHVKVNNRHPWIIRYSFDVAGRVYDGKVTTLNSSGILPPGSATCVLYLPDQPEINSLYPHP